MRLTALSMIQDDGQRAHGRLLAVRALQHPATCTGAIDGRIFKRAPPCSPGDADPIVADKLDLTVLPFDRDRHQTDDHQHQQYSEKTDSKNAKIGLRRGCFSTTSSDMFPPESIMGSEHVKKIFGRVVTREFAKEQRVDFSCKKRVAIRIRNATPTRSYNQLRVKVLATLFAHYES